MEALIDWKDDINQIVADTVEGTWVYPKYVMLLCGLPRAGKSVFSGVLAAGFREAFESKRNTDGTTPQVRVCGSEFHEVHASSLRGMGRQMAEDDVKLSLQAADVVIIDEMHLTAADRQPIIAVVTSEWVSVGCEGAVVTVKLSCRDKARALKSNKQSRRPLPPATVEVLFQQFAADTEVPAFTVESFAQPE
ncbi:hypothetical protein PF010_g18732 [Phytophthora fragariae]|uniref:AAA+ ATPase domain-containing protein n=1 Tax=Phytophthora fragariae TaxID=53985 RepID=A0A6A3EUQ6_9STRA|nr:hypothetical protein PF009_g16239 [Phytophthora fragariae]KAE9090084.1 hypothetical protein PF010_g18732 [Phytophthora fragariae]